MSLTKEHEEARNRSKRIKSVCQRLSRNLDAVHGTVQELHDICVETVTTKLNAANFDDSNWLRTFQVSGLISIFQPAMLLCVCPLTVLAEQLIFCIKNEILLDQTKIVAYLWSVSRSVRESMLIHLVKLTRRSRSFRSTKLLSPRRVTDGLFRDPPRCSTQWDEASVSIFPKTHSFLRPPMGAISVSSIIWPNYHQLYSYREWSRQYNFVYE